MRMPNYSETAVYFERRATKAASDRRRAHLASIARLYREKAREAGTVSDDAMPGETNGPSRRERIAAMFRALGDPASIAKSNRVLDLPEGMKT
jgi:hypothetical protein